MSDGHGRAGDHAAYTRRVLIAVGITAATVVILLLAWASAGVLFLVFAAILLASLLRGLADVLARHTPLPPRAAVGVVVLLIALVLVVGGWLLGPRVGDQMQELAERLPEAVAHLRDELGRSRAGRWILHQAPTLEEAASTAASGAGGGEGGNGGGGNGGGGAGGMMAGLTGFFSTVFGALGNLAFIVFAGVYFALGPQVYLDGIIRLVPISRRDRVRQVFMNIEHQLRWWLVGRFSSMAVVAVLTTLGLLLVGMPLAVSLGVLAGLLSFIPVIGPILSAVPALIIAAVASPALFFWVLLVYVAVQTLESYIITPLIQQRAVALPPVLILLAQLLFGLAAGFVGVAVATPLALALIIAIKSLYVQDTLGDTEVNAELSH